MPTARNTKCLSMLFLACLSLAGAATASASSNMFLKIDGIKGESVDDRHKDEIDVMSWSWGVGPRDEGKAGKRGCVQDLTLTKLVDRSSPPLVGAAALGSQIPRAVLTVRSLGGQPQEFLVLDLSQVYVTSVQQAISAGNNQFYEQVTLKAGTIVMTYRPQNPDGSQGTPVSSSVSGGC